MTLFANRFEQNSQIDTFFTNERLNCVKKKKKNLLTKLKITFLVLLCF